MKGKNMNKGKTMLICMTIIAVCAMLVMGGTYALFTDTDTYNNRLQAGELDVALKRVAYSSHVLNADGYMSDSSNDDEKDLTQEGTTLFDITPETSLIVPTAWYESVIKITNDGNVAFDYSLKIVDNADFTNVNQALSEQIKITVSRYNEQTQKYDEVKSDTLANLSVAEQNLPLGYFDNTAGAYHLYKIKMEFLDDTDRDDFDNNDAMQAVADFDIEIHATQKTAPETTTAP